MIAIAPPDVKTFLSAYPKIRLRLTMGAGGSIAQRLGVEPTKREVVIDIEALEVSKAMGALGWAKVEPGQSALAITALDSLLDSMVENAAWASGYEKSAQGMAREALRRIDPRWDECVEGLVPWSAGAMAAGAWIETALHLSSSRSYEKGDFLGAEWMSMHERGAQVLVATIVDQFTRLGAATSIAWSLGFQDWSQSVSSLPEEWSWPTLGAALCVELGDESAVCASFSRQGIKALAQSPLGRAMGPRSSLTLLGSVKALKIVCGPHRADRSYRYAALPGMPNKHFPCHTIQARSAWREETAATAEEAMAAVREVVGAKGLLSVDWVAPSPEALGAMGRDGVQLWLGGCEARIEAKKMASALGKAGVAKAPSKPRL